MNLLEVENISKSFGAVTAINGLSFNVPEGSVLGIMGPNGAGKTTLFSLIMGAFPLDSGTVKFDGKAINGLPTSTICHLGLGRTYQIPQPFRQMTVLENLMVGQLYGRNRHGLRDARGNAQRLLEKVGLLSRANTRAEQLGLLDLKRLELARALSTEPRLLLLDEVAGGLVESEVEELERIIGDLKSSGQTMIVIEHVLRTLFKHSDQILVMNFGTKVTEGLPDQVAKNADVIDIYLGQELEKSKLPVTTTPAKSSSETMLEVKDLSAGYGAFQALFNVNLEIKKGEIVALLGINGAGKTTLIRAITRQLALTSGDVIWQGLSLNNRKAHDIAELGIAQCIEGRKIFKLMTVRENLEIGAYPKRARAEKDVTLETVYELFPRLRERETQLGGTLSGGEQQMLAIGRALMARPELLILDEVSLGLAPKIIDTIYASIPKIVAAGTTVLLIEQNVHRSLEIADRAYILERGRIMLSGTAQELAANPDVQAAYFGLEPSH